MYDEEFNEDVSGEESVYDEEGREELVEGGEISPQEAAFMQGYDEASEDEDEDADGEEE